MTASLTVPLPPHTLRAAAGTPAYRLLTRAIALGGFAAFAMLYGLQPLMPLFSREFGLSPAAASGVVSITTGTLALSLIPAGLLARKVAPRTLMLGSLILAALFNLLAAFAPDYTTLLWLRGLLGVALAGLPAVSMAYLAEEVEPEALGRAIGLLIAANALGGMSGRLVSAVLGDWFGWRIVVASLALMGTLAAMEFWRSLPARAHAAAPLDLAAMWMDMRRHWQDPGLPALFAVAFLLMGCFVSIYNYLGYRLEAAPFSLRPGVAGMIFSAYIVGMFAANYAGRLADRLGRRRVLWGMVLIMALGVLLTLPEQLASITAGVVVFTFGVFGAHTVASSWVGRRAAHSRTLASSLYLTAYYLGGSVLGSVLGWVWEHGHWLAVALSLMAILFLCLLLALRLRKLEPLPAT